MEDLILYADATEAEASGENPYKKLLKKEQRLLDRLQQEQEAEVEAQERFRRAEARLQRRRKRLERIQSKLSLVQEKLAALHITDQHMVYKEHEVILVPLPEETSQAASEEDSLTQPEQGDVTAQEVDLSPAYTGNADSGTIGQQQEHTSTDIDANDVVSNDGGEEMANEEEVSIPQQETTSPVEQFTYELIDAPVEPEFESTSEERSDEEPFAQQEISSPVPHSYEPSESSLEPDTPASYEEADTSNISSSENESTQELETNPPTSIEATMANEHEQEPSMTSGSNDVEDEAEASESKDASSETIIERRPTKPLQLEQPVPTVAMSHDSRVQSAKEAWIAAESTMQNARNAANGINASISFLSQTDGLSDEFMEELVRKQDDANRELLKAQEAARAAYEHFVQEQRDAQPADSQSVNTAEDTSLPPAEENGLDQTAKLHAVRLYTEW